MEDAEEDIHPNGMSDTAVYWAEDRILGGVAPFDHKDMLPGEDLPGGQSSEVQLRGGSYAPSHLPRRLGKEASKQGRTIGPQSPTAG
jgi:hypothetical protein